MASPQLIQNPLLPSTLTGSVDLTTSTNAFQLDLTAFPRSTASISLTDLSGDANLQVFRVGTGGKTLVKESKNVGKLSESILLGTTALTPGIYTVEVALGDSLSAGYKLDITVNADVTLSNLWWRNLPRAETAIWQMNGANLASLEVYANLGPEWKLQGVADLNDDGEDDLLWRDTNNGKVAYWIFKGGSLVAAALSYSEPTSLEWQITSVQDLNGDGQADIVWHNATSGQVALWTLRDGEYRDLGVYAPGTPWKPIGSGDFNGDGRSDIILQNSRDGQTAIWLMDGTSVAEGKVIPSGTVWQPQFYGDVNGDGQDDIVLRNMVDGGMAFWLMNGANIQSIWVGPNVSLDWQIAGLENFDSSANGGSKDLLFRNSATGQLAIWLLNQTGTGFASAQLVNPPSADGQGYSASWKIAGISDFNNDGKQDILYHSEQAGMVNILLMDGATVIGKQEFTNGSSDWRIQGIMKRQLMSQPFEISGRTSDGNYNNVTAFDLGTLDGSGMYKDSVLPGRADYFKFNVSTASNVTLSVAEAGAQLDLFSLLGDGTLGAAIVLGNEMLLGAGSYAVRVSTTTQANLSYTLNAFGKPQATDVLGVEFTASPTVALNPSANNQSNVVTASFRVKNNGSTTIQNVEVGFLFSRDSQIQPSSNRDVKLKLNSNPMLDYVTLENPLAPGATSDLITVQLRLPDTSSQFWYADGNYTIGMVVDPRNQFSNETSETNNFNVALGTDKATLGITQTETIELIGSNFQQTGGTFAAGEIITASFTVSNIGNRAVSVSDSVPIRFYLSSDTTIDASGSDALLIVADANSNINAAGFGTYFIDPSNGTSALLGTSSRVIQLQLQLPTLQQWSGWGSGTFYLSSWIDPTEDKVTGENDKVNNKLDPELVGTPDDTIDKNYLKFPR